MKDLDITVIDLPCDECKKVFNIKELRSHMIGWVKMGMPEGNFCSNCICGHWWH